MMLASPVIRIEKIIDGFAVLKANLRELLPQLLNVGFPHSLYTDPTGFNSFSHADCAVRLVESGGTDRNMAANASRSSRDTQSFILPLAQQRAITLAHVG